MAFLGRSFIWNLWHYYTKNFLNLRNVLHADICLFDINHFLKVYSGPTLGDKECHVANLCSYLLPRNLKVTHGVFFFFSCFSWVVNVLGKARWSLFVVTFTVVAGIIQTILCFSMKEIWKKTQVWGEKH